MAKETHQLANFAQALKYEDIPVSARNKAIDILVDQIGCAVGCSELPWAKAVYHTYASTGGDAEATVIRYGDRLPVTAVAVINSTFGHSFEYDDGNPQFLGHPGAELIPSLMAIAERGHNSGRDFLTAFIAAYEVRGRIGWAVVDDMRTRGGPQFSTTCGPFGVAVGAAKLMELGEEGIHNAMGIAGAYTGGLMQYGNGGGSVKRIYAAIAASNGIQSAQLAQAGITGPEGILEGSRGLLKIFSTTYLPERLVAEFGTKWMLETAYFKPYCCVGIIAGAIDGLLKIKSNHVFSVNDVQSVVVGYPTGFHEHAAISVPRDLLGMQFSTSYALALAMLKGNNTPREYTDEALKDSAINAFAAKVRVVEETEIGSQFPGRMPASVEIKLKSGTSNRELVVDAKGSPGAPLSRDEIADKFRSQVTDSLGQDRCESLLSALLNIDQLKDMSKLPPTLVIGNSKR